MKRWQIIGPVGLLTILLAIGLLLPHGHSSPPQTMTTILATGTILPTPPDPLTSTLTLDYCVEMNLPAGLGAFHVNSRDGVIRGGRCDA